MAFVVEDGTGLSNATAYISVAYFKSYHDDRRHDPPIWASDEDIQGAIVKASDFIDRRWRRKFKGQRFSVSQTLEFPRINAYYFDGRTIAGNPAEVQQATAELAMRVLETSSDKSKRTLVPDPEYDAKNRDIVEESVSVGPLRQTVRYRDDGVITSWREYPAIEGLLRDIVEEGSSLNLLKT